jgi:large subunit ribosomal protein L10
LSKEKKGQIIDELQDEFSRCNIGILTDYRGLSNSEITTLRRRLQDSDGAYRVVKNTLARLAAEHIDRAEVADYFTGPVAIAFGYGEITSTARVLMEYVRSAGTTVSVKGGFLPDRLLTAQDITTLATLPSREVMLARVVGGMKSPINGLVTCLASPLRGLAWVLQARISQLEEN